MISIFQPNIHDFFYYFMVQSYFIQWKGVLMKPKTILIVFFILFYSLLTFAQEKRHDKGIFIKREKGFYNQILESIKAYDSIPKPEHKYFKVDVSGMDLPKSINEFKSCWYNEPLSQGNTGTCWSFSTTSFLESEVYRLHQKKVKLSEMYTVYWEYTEKAKRFVEERGNSEFGEGSEANAVTRIWKKYGCVPENVYNGMLSGQKFHNHSKMFDEMYAYLQNLKLSNDWDGEEAVNTIKSILNHYMGEPPAEFEADGKKYTPKEYLIEFYSD